MKKVNMVYGTVYGGAQSVAESLSVEMKQLNYDVTLWQPQQLDEYIPTEDELLVMVCSSTGQGDLPDDILPWFTKMKAQSPYLPKLKYAVVALGDSSYETYCGAGKQLDTLFSDFGALRVLPVLEIDAMETMEPEVDALEWLKDWHKKLSA